MLVAYGVLFVRANLLTVNVLVYFGPIVAMAATLVLIHRAVDFDDIPGSDRLSALVTLLALSFAIVFLLSRSFFGAFFFGSIGYLIAICVVVFALLKWSARTAFRRRGAPRPVRPAL